MIDKIIRRLIPNKLVNDLKKKLGVPNQESSFLRLKNLGFMPKTILDIGAYEGKWAEEISVIFPSAHILMIEGQKNKKDILLKKSKNIPNSNVKIALLGAKNKKVEFNIYETASSVFKEDNQTNAKIEQIELTLLDALVAGTEFEYSDLIKLDTQGYELEILKGGSNALKSAKVILMEVSLLEIYKGAPLIDEVIGFMKVNGFVLYDICSIMRRPYDQALFQSDFLFLKEEHLLRSSTRWE